MSNQNADSPVWHTLTSEEIAKQLNVDPAQGLTTAEAASRLQQVGALLHK